MARRNHLVAFECLGMALRAANRTSDHQFSLQSFRMLVALYNASERGKVLTKNGLIERMDAMANIRQMNAGYVMLHRLIVKGMIECSGQGRKAIVFPTLAGRNYIKAVERYLKNLKPGSY